MSEHTELIKHFHDSYLARFGVKYNFTQGKDGRHIKTMLATFGLNLSKAIITEFLSDEDDFLKKAGHTIGVLITRTNAYAAKIAAAPTVKGMMSDRERRNLQVSMDYLKGKQHGFGRSAGVRPDVKQVGDGVPSRSKRDAD